MWLFGGKHERFSVEELRRLCDQLQKYSALKTDVHQGAVVETLRSLAELMIWGDQHDSDIVDFFVENRALKWLLTILNQKGNARGPIAVQILQTLSMMIQNMSTDPAIYYLFSNFHMNIIISYPFDFSDEEVLGYYISFLKTISGKLNEGTISFFIEKQESGVLHFPLYTEAIKFFHHEETMVRIAVRTLTLKVYHVRDAAVPKCVLADRNVGYFWDLVTFVRQQIFALDSLLSENESRGNITAGRLEGAVAEVSDLLFYCNDILNAGIADLSAIMMDHMMSILVIPVLLVSLTPEGEEALHSTTALGRPSSVCGMCLLARLIIAISYKPLVDGVVATILASSGTELGGILASPGTELAGGALGGGHADGLGFGQDIQAGVGALGPGAGEASRGRGQRREPGDRTGRGEESKGENGALASSPGSTVEHGGPSSSPSEEEAWRGCVPDRGAGVASTSGQGGRDGEWRPQEGAWLRSCRDLLLFYLSCPDDRRVLAALSVYTALLQNGAIDEALLDAMGILPRQRRQRKLLLQALISPAADEELARVLSDEDAGGGQPLSVAASDADLEAAVGGDRLLETASREDGRTDLRDAHSSGWGLGGDAALHWNQMLHILLNILTRDPPLSGAVLGCCSGLLRQLLPQGDPRLSHLHLRQLELAYARSREAVLHEVTDCWCDVLPAALAADWTGCRRALESLEVPRETSVFLPPAKYALPGDTTSSLAVADRMLKAVKVFLTLHQLRSVVLHGRTEESLTLGEPCPVPSGARSGRRGISLARVGEGSEIELVAGEALPCRVSFARGKERTMWLLVATSGTSGSLLLAEASPSRLRHGRVQISAPLADCQPLIDKRHAKWLHLRIRSPRTPVEVTTSRASSGQTRARRIEDGRWTVAFASEESALQARQMVLEEIEVQRKAVGDVVRPLLQAGSGRDSVAHEEHQNLEQ